MKPTPARPLRLADLAILVAGSALAFFLITNIHNYTNLLSSPYPLRLSAQQIFFCDAHAVLAAWAVTLLGLRLTGPGPRSGRRIRQPGTVACLSFLAGWALALALAQVKAWGLDLFTPDPSAFRIKPFGDYQILMLHSFHGGEFVVASWATLALVRRWHPERGWIDATGRAFGGVAILVLVALRASI